MSGQIMGGDREREDGAYQNLSSYETPCTQSMLVEHSSQTSLIVSTRLTSPALGANLTIDR